MIDTAPTFPSWVGHTVFIITVYTVVGKFMCYNYLYVERNSILPSSCSFWVTPFAHYWTDHDSDDCNSDEEENSWSLRGAAARQRVGTHMLVSFVRVVKDRPITELSLVESTQDEYITRHSMNGQILYTDHRWVQAGVTRDLSTNCAEQSMLRWLHAR